MTDARDFFGGMFVGFLIMLVMGFIYVISLSLAPTCLEDEVAIHGGIENYYDRHDELECVNIEEFLVIIGEEK